MSKACPHLRAMVLPISGAYALREPARSFTSLQRMWLGLQPKMGTKRAPCWTDEELRALAEGCPKLEELRLEEGREGFPAISGASLAAFGNRLTDLSLARLSSMLDTAGLIRFAAAAGSSLRRLDLSDCRIRDPDVAVHAIVRDCVVLERLDISGVQDLLLRKRFESIGCMQLQYLSVGAGRLGSTCAVEIGGPLSLVMSCPRLSALMLCNRQLANSLRMELLRTEDMSTRLHTLAITVDDGVEDDVVRHDPGSNTLHDMGSVAIALLQQEQTCLADAKGELHHDRNANTASKREE